MSLNSIRTKLIMDANQFTSGAKQGYQAIKSLEGNFKSLNTSVKRTKVEIEGLNATLVNVASAMRSFERMENIFSSVIGGAYNYNKVLETNAVGIAGVLTAMVKVNNKELEWNESMAMSTEIMNKLRKEALRTSSTAPELIGTFSGLLGIGLGAKMSIEEMLHFTTVGVNAVKSMGLNGTQLIQELRGLLQGGIKPASSTLATALGLKDKDIKEAKASSEGLFRFLMKRLEGFDKSVKATSNTMQGRLDILQEGFYQGIGEGTKDLWKEALKDVKALSENFLIFNKEANQMELNPKFVAQVKSVEKAILDVKGAFGGLFDGMTKDASSLLKAFVLGAGFKLITAGMTSFVGLLTKGAKPAADLLNSLSSANMELKRELETMQKLDAINSRMSVSAERQRLLNSLTAKYSSEVYNLAKHFEKLGADAKTAQEMQNKIVRSINKGYDVGTIEHQKKAFEEMSIKMKAYNDERKRAGEIDKKNNEAILAQTKEQLALQKQLDAIKMKAGKGILGASGVVAKEINKDARETALINNVLLDREKQRVAHEKEIAKAQKEQFTWLEKQINASVKLASNKSANNNEALKYSLLQKNLNEIKQKAEAHKPSADALYIKKFLDPEQGVKGYTKLNAERLTRLMEASKNAGFSKNIQESIGRDFIKQLQSADASSRGNKKYFENTLKELESVKTKFAEIKAESQNIFKTALDAGLLREQAEKLREEYVAVMTSAGKDSANAWKQSFEKNIISVKEKIDGVMRGSGVGNKMSTINSKEQLAEARKNLEAEYQRTIKAYEKANVEGAKKIKSVFDTIKKAQDERMISAEQANKLELEYTIKVVKGYYDEAIAIQGVIEKQYQEGILAEETAKKEREKVAQKEKEKAVNKDIANGIERLKTLEGELLTNRERNGIMFAQINALEAKGYTRNVNILQQLFKEEERIANKVRETGEQAPPIYNKIIETIQKLLETERELTKEEQKQIEIILEKSKAFGAMETGLSRLRSIANSSFSAFSSLGFAISMCGFESESATGKFAEWAIKIGFVGSSVLSLIDSLKELWGTLTAIKTAGFGAFIGALGKGTAIVGTVALGTILLKLGTEGVDVTDPKQVWDIMKQRYFAKTQEEIDALREQADSEQYSNDNAYNLAPNGDITLKNPPKEGGGDSKAKREADRLAKLEEQARKARDSYVGLVDTLKIANGELMYTYTEFDKQEDEAIKKVDNWRKQLNAMFVQAGGKLDDNNNIISEGKITKKEYDDINNSLGTYLQLKERAIFFNSQEKENINTLQHIQNLQDMGTLSLAKANELRVEAHQKQMELYQREMERYEEGSTKRIELERKVAEERKAIQEASMTETKIQWDSVLEHIRNTSFNLTETFNNGIDTMIGRFTDFGQNIIGNTKSVTEQLRDLCKNLTSDILNMMMKIYMQGLMMNLIGNIFGGGGGTPKIADAGSPSGGGMGLSGFWDGDRFANGGYASGWAMVGERGPELVNFSNPAHVYTAEQTKNALSGNGGGVNVVINLKNESGQQVEAQQTGSSFDGENYVVGVVLKAISTNKNGMRNIIKGVATT